MAHLGSEKQTLELAKIPKILDLMVEKGAIDDDQREAILARINILPKEEKKGFAGEVGIKLGFFNKATFDKYLLEQTALKAEAAVKDIQSIRKDGAHQAPSWLKANWGNNGVNPASKKPTIADGVSAAANIAQNIVMIANLYPDTVDDKLAEVVSAAANLARGIANGNSVKVPLLKNSAEWLEILSGGLSSLVTRTGYQPTDFKVATIKINDFIKARASEIEAGVKLSLAQTPTEEKAATK